MSKFNQKLLFLFIGLFLVFSFLLAGCDKKQPVISDNNNANNVSDNNNTTQNNNNVNNGNNNNQQNNNQNGDEDPYKDWKTYRNDSLVFKYPDDWYVKEIISEEEDNRIIVDNNKIEIEFEENIELHPEEIVLSWQKEGSLSDVKESLKEAIVSISETNIDDKEASVIDYYGPPGVKGSPVNTLIYVEVFEKYLVVSNTFTNYKDIFNKIVESININ